MRCIQSLLVLKIQCEMHIYYKQSLTGTYVPNIDTLALNWDFSNVTGSGNSTSAGSYDATFIVQDISSGSTSLKH